MSYKYWFKNINWHKFWLRAIAGTIFWDVVLTPYLLLYIHMTIEQYTKWLITNSVLTPFVAPLSVVFINWFVGICTKQKARIV